MAIELPGPVADFLGFIGINWPNVNEDKVREFGQHVAQFGQCLQQTQQDASTTVQSLGQAYQGAGYEQLLATWGAKSDSHMSELITGCQLVSTAMDAGADVIVGMKVEAIAPARRDGRRVPRRPGRRRSRRSARPRRSRR